MTKAPEKLLFCRFHRLVVAILKAYLPNDQLKIITYTDYKKFDIKLEEFQLELIKLGLLAKNIDIFQSVKFLIVIPLKNINILGVTKLYWVNHAIMVRSKLQHKHRKSRSDKKREKHARNKEICVFVW